MGGAGGTTVAGRSAVSGGITVAGGQTAVAGATSAGGALLAGATGGTTPPKTGGAISSGGTRVLSTGTSTTPAPTSGLAVKVTKQISGTPGEIAFSLMIENKNSQAADLAAVTMRYWFAEESLGATLVLNSDYVTVGYSNKGKVTAVKSVANSSGGAGADHYLEFSFEATLGAKGDKDTTDQFTVNVTVHNSGFSGKVDVTNDYSYNGGAVGYNDKITLHGGGKLIWGTPPGPADPGGGNPDAGILEPPPSPDAAPDKAAISPPQPDAWIAPPTNCIQSFINNGYALSAPADGGVQACSACRGANGNSLETSCKTMVDCLAAVWVCKTTGACWLNCRNSTPGGDMPLDSCVTSLVSKACP
jgi:hypothetical protein